MTNKPILISLAAASAAVVFAAFISRKQPKQSPEVLTELTLSVHEVLREMGQMATRVRQVLAMKGMSGQITDQEIAEILLTQGIAEKLQVAQTKVLEAHGVSEAEIQQWTGIEGFNEGFEEMFNTAVKGGIPVLPGFSVPERLTEEKMIDILLAMGERKLKYFRELVEQKKPENAEMFFSDVEVGKSLEEANEQAEKEILEKVGKDLRKAVFYSALGVMSRDKHFENERKRIDRLHQAAIMRLFGSVESELSEVSEGVKGDIKRVTQDSLPMVLMEATERGVSTVVALLKPEIPVGKFSDILSPLCEKIESIKAEFGAKTPLFAFMKAEKESPLVQHEKCADKDVVYVVFARPDVAKRPVACLSIDELVYALKDLSGLAADPAASGESSAPVQE